MMPVEPIVRPKQQQQSTAVEVWTNRSISDGQCCACPKSKEQISVEDEERRYQIAFENFLHDSVYRKELK